MDLVVADITPAEEWEASLNATCNRLSTQYLNLIRAASSTTLTLETASDPRAGGGIMRSEKEPPPPVVADASLHELQAHLAVDNLIVASNHLLDLIRTLRLSLILMDEDTIAAQEEYEVTKSQEITKEAQKMANEMEAQLIFLRNSL